MYVQLGALGIQPNMNLPRATTLDFLNILCMAWYTDRIVKRKAYLQQMRSTTPSKDLLKVRRTILHIYHFIILSIHIFFFAATLLNGE